MKLGDQLVRLMDLSQPTIIIPEPSDPKFGYLSASSPHAFTIDEKCWPTITHFIMGKQFEGTLLEEDIRKAKNASLAKMMARKRRFIFQEDGHAIKKTVYGSTKSYQMKADWEDVRTQYLTIALKAKFDQHPRLKKRLLDTDGMSIVDPHDERFGKIIEDIRKEYLSTTTQRFPGNYISFEIPPVDLKTETITAEENSIVTSIIMIAGWIRDIEGVDQHIDMFEDALWNLIPDEELLVAIRTWMGVILPQWSSVVKDLPKFEKMVREVEKKLPAANLRTAIYIASFIRWFRLDAEDHEIIVTNAQKIKKRTVIIPPMVRTYRRVMPTSISPHPVAKKLSYRGITAQGRIRMTDDRRGLILRGKEIQRYKPQLVALGGRSRGKSIEIPREAKRTAGAIFFKDLADEKKRSAAYYSWWQERLGLLIDTARQTSQLLSSKGITPKIMKAVIDHIYSFTPRKITPKDIPPRLTSEIHKIFNISAKIQEVMAPTYLSASSNKEILDYDQYFHLFDEECGWLRSKPPTALSRYFSEADFTLFRAIKNVMDTATITLGYPYSLEVAVWSFLTVCPGSIRKDAEKYTKSILKGYSEAWDMEQANKHLSTFSYSGLQPIVDVLVSTGVGSVPVPSLVVMAIARTFHRTRASLFEERILLMRGDDSVVKIKSIEIDTVVYPTPPDTNEEEPVKGKIIIGTENLLKFKEAPWILTIANTTSAGVPKTTKSERVTKRIYVKYPYANIYSLANGPRTKNLGTTIFSFPKNADTDVKIASTPAHRYVASLLCEWSCGGPKKIEDTLENRKMWFSKSLAMLPETITKGEILAIAEDSLAEGYREILETFAKQHGYTIYILTSRPKIAELKKVEVVKNGQEGVVPQVREEDSDESCSRGILYATLFEPRRLPSKDYSLLVNGLESLATIPRKLWLEKYEAVSDVEKGTLIKDLIDRTSDEK